jgi:hypothetical protein
MHVDGTVTKRYLSLAIRASPASVPTEGNDMNAVFREKDKVPVISNDAIEAKLNHLHEGLQDVRRSQTSLLEKLDALGKDVLARFEKQSNQTNSIAKRLDAIYVGVKVVLAILGLCVSAAVVTNALRTLGWI